MDPTLIAAARQIMQNPDAYPDAEGFIRQATGGKYGFDDAAAYLKTINPGVTPGNVGRSLLQGATMNFADEAMDKIPAGVRSAIGTGLRNAPFGIGPAVTQLTSDLGSSGEDMRARNDAFAQAHPWISGGANMAGAVGSAMGAAAALPELGVGAAVSKLPGPVRAAYALLKGAGAGFGMGTASDVGNQEGPKDLGAAATSFPAVAGAVGGVAAPAIVGAARYIAQPSAQSANRLGTAVAQSKGLQALLDRLQQFRDAGLGDQVTAGDLSGPMGAARKFVMQNSEEAAADAVPMLEGRAAGAAGRMMNKVKALNPEFSEGPLFKNADTGEVAPLSNDWRLMDLANEIKAWRKGPTGYDALNPNQTLVPGTNLIAKPAMGPGASPGAEAHLRLSENPIFKGTDPQTLAKNILARPENAGTPMAQNAQAFLDHMNDVGTPAQPIAPPVLGKPGVIASALAKAQQVGIVGDIDPETATLGKMMHIQNQLQDRADQLITAGGGKSNEGFELAKAAQQIDDHIAATNPGYMRANHSYGELKSAQRTVEDFRNAWNSGDPEVLQRKIDAMTPANQLEARRALAADLNQQFNNSGGQQNVARQILDASQQRNIGNAPPAVQARLQVLFGNDDNYTKFMEHAALEHQMAAAKSSYVGSDTYKNIKAATIEPVSMAAQGAAQTFSPSISNMIQSTLRRTGLKAVLNKMNEGAANEMHDVLNTPGADAVERLLRGLTPGTNPLVGAGSTVGAPAAVSAGAASLKKHFAQF